MTRTKYFDDEFDILWSPVSSRFYICWRSNSPCCYVHVALLTLMMKMLVMNVISGDQSICTYIYMYIYIKMYINYIYMHIKRSDSNHVVGVDSGALWFQLDLAAVVVGAVNSFGWDVASSWFSRQTRSDANSMAIAVVMHGPAARHLNNCWILHRNYMAMGQY